MPAQPTELHTRLIDLFGNPATADPTKLYGNLTVNPTGTVGIGTGLVMPDGYTIASTPIGRNRVINGDCRVQQRPSFAPTTNTGGYGGPDRFCATNGGPSAGGQFTQSAGTITFGGIVRPAVVQTVNTAVVNLTSNNYWGGFDHRIEGLNAYDLQGQPVTISFIFNSNVTGTFSVALRDINGPNSYVTTFAATANTPVKVTIPVSAIGFSIANNNSIGLIISIGALNQATFQTSSLTAWQAGNYLTATGATNWGASAGNFISLTELQLETGAVATPFERRSIAYELMLCQRYYEVFGNGTIQTGGYANGGNVLPFAFPFKVSKRTSATVVGLGTQTQGNCTVSAIANSDAYIPSITVTSTGTFIYQTSSAAFNAEL